jgi:hypothetical protein
MSSPEELSASSPDEVPLSDAEVDDLFGDDEEELRYANCVYGDLANASQPGTHSGTRARR